MYAMSCFIQYLQVVIPANMPESAYPYGGVHMELLFILFINIQNILHAAMGYYEHCIVTSVVPS